MVVWRGGGEVVGGLGGGLGGGWRRKGGGGGALVSGLLSWLIQCIDFKLGFFLFFSFLAIGAVSRV